MKRELKSQDFRESRRRDAIHRVRVVTLDRGRGRDDELSQPRSVMGCHSERSEESPGALSQILRCAQNDSLTDLVRENSSSRPYDGIAINLCGGCYADNYICIARSKATDLRHSAIAAYEGAPDAAQL
jgi:hypothetical protein